MDFELTPQQQALQDEIYAYMDELMRASRSAVTAMEQIEALLRKAMAECQ